MDTSAEQPTPPSEPPMTCHAVRDDALGTDDAVGIARRIAGREISASEAVAASIERARSVDEQLGALVLERFEQAAAEAETPRAGAFSGVPMMVKDMSDLAGYPTKWGSATLEDAGDATKTAPEIAQMLDMGMIALGKTTLPDFGIICSAEYPDGVPTRNPWNLGHTPGGSSSGSAALVAAGTVPIAHGADGGGSIRIPASACGLVGLKASRGRIIEEPAAKVQPVRVTTHGVLTRSVRDTWTYFAEAERRFAPKGLAAIGSLGNPLESKLRVGVTTATLNGATIDDATIRVVGETIALLESAGHDVEEIPLPVAPTMADDFILNYGFLTLMISKGGRKLFDPSFDPERLTPVVQGFADHCRRNLAKMPGVWRRLRASTAEAEELFKRNDVILTPTVGQVPPPIGYFDTAMSYDDLMERVAAWACFTPWDNATGAPSISLPLGHDPLTNLPVGMLFHAAMGNERLLLELGLQLEAAQPPRSITGSPSGS